MGMSVEINSLEDMCMLMCDNVIPEHKKHYSKCLRCGRALKSEQSKIRGYGKICEQKMQSESVFALF